MEQVVVDGPQDLKPRNHPKRYDAKMTKKPAKTSNKIPKSSLSIKDAQMDPNWGQCLAYAEHEIEYWIGIDGYSYDDIINLSIYFVETQKG